jgi:hypothetical protein
MGCSQIRGKLVPEKWTGHYFYVTFDENVYELSSIFKFDVSVLKICMAFEYMYIYCMFKIILYHNFGLFSFFSSSHDL